LPDDIAALPLAGTRVAVLSACATGAGAESRGEGVLSLVRPFLAAGVPHVVASLWSVRDDDTRPLMVALHRRLLAGEPPSAALRSAQLEALRSSGGRAGTWAAFMTVGTL
jgi:CHAT domain-containing protein